MANIDIGKMADAIMKELEQYADVTTEGMKKLAKEVGKLQRTSPKATGDYAKRWTSTVRAESANSIAVSVHDKKYQISHLLEKGHQKRNGGRTPAIVHIAPEEKEATEKMEKGLIKIV